MSGALSVFPLLGLLSASAPALSDEQARPKFVGIGWSVVEVLASETPIALKRGEAAPFLRVVPRDLITLEEDAVAETGKTVVAGGSPLAWSTLGGRIACEPEPRLLTSFACLEDSDGDGAFDYWGRVQAQVFGAFEMVSYRYLIGQFRLQQRKPLLRRVKVPLESRSKTFVPVPIDLVYLRGGGTQDVFALCVLRVFGKDIWGGEIRKRYCFPELRAHRSQYPSTLELGAGTMTVHSVADEVVRVSFRLPPVGQRID